MFVSEDLVFVELHKTAGTHIGKWLARLTPGEQVGKHNRVPDSLRDRFVLGSIRNPWDWYVSLWAFGCGGKGSVYLHTTGKHGLGYGLNRLPDEMGMSRPLTAGLRQVLADLRLPKDTWNGVYRDSNDARQFRQWLRLLLDEERRFDIGEGYGFSKLSSCAGLMTYRFLKLFSNLGDGLYAPDLCAEPEALREVWRQHRVTQFEIRSERLETDLLEALSMADIEVPSEVAEELVAASNRRTNTSSRLPAEHYYDDRSIELVRNRERLIVDEYGYSPPGIARPAA